MASSSIELDLRGLKCPLPVLRTRKALRHLGVGEVLVVRCTDPLSVIDIPHFVRSEGHAVVSQDPVEGVVSFVIVKAAGAGP